MVNHENVLTIIKGYLTHLVALSLIALFAYLLFKSAFNPEIKIPEILTSLGSGAVGFYLSGLNKKTI